MRSLQPVLKTARFLWGRARPRLSSREAAKECSPQRKPWVGGRQNWGFSTAVTQKKSNSCDEQPLLRFKQNADWVYARHHLTCKPEQIGRGPRR